MRQHAKALQDFHLRDVMGNPMRTGLMSIDAAGLTLDFSHQRILPETLQHFESFAAAHALHGRMAALMCGDKVNVSESRPALHTALRAPITQGVKVDGENIMPKVHASLDKMRQVSEALFSSGFTDVLVIGIGGSYWGSAAVCQALQGYHPRMRVHFLADMESGAFESVAGALLPQSTVCVVISKSFTTKETLANALLARDRFPAMLAVTANVNAAQTFGISADHIFEMWPWVGGRYSVWSAVGLPIAISYGFDVFAQLLQGAYAMDQHTLTADATNNLPMMAALCTYWNTQYWGASTEVILPYSFRLAHFIPYVQQLSMESLGKQRTTAGERITTPTGPIVWGHTGLHAQHTFNQLLHQGNHCVSIEFILPMADKAIVQSCLAQSYALTYGDPDNPLPHARIEGNQPHQIIQMDKITPFNLGVLMAFYEHKTYLLGCLLGVNPFDQFGVELAKRIHRDA